MSPGPDYLWEVTLKSPRSIMASRVKSKMPLLLASHQKMSKAYDEGFFDDMLTPYLGLTRDNNVRKDTSMESWRN